MDEDETSIGQGGMTVSDLYGDAISDQRCSLSLELQEVPLIPGNRDVPYVPRTLGCRFWLRRGMRRPERGNDGSDGKETGRTGGASEQATQH